MIKDSVMKNWKTTLAGCALAVSNTGLSLMATGAVDLQTLLLSCFFVALGVLAKDYNVTGN